MKTKSGIEIPADLAEALRAGTGLLAQWRRLRPSCQREYVASVTEATRPETRQRRIAAVVHSTVEWNVRHRDPRAAELASGRR